MKKIIIILISVLALGGGVVFIAQHPSAPEPTSTPNLTSDVRGVTTEAFVYEGESEPLQLSIPVINVKAKIEPVGKDTDGNMDVPKDAYTVGWWSLGYRLGGIGNVVLDGHVDTPEGEPGVFYNLSTLKNGDEIEVFDNKKRKFTYVVVDTKEYEEVNFPIDLVFSKLDGQKLNLITCSGVFNQAVKKYDKRYVIFSSLKNVVTVE